MVVVDTSVWVEVFRDASGSRRDALRRTLGDEKTAPRGFHELEMLQGCRDEKEWGLLKSYLTLRLADDRCEQPLGHTVLGRVESSV